MFGKKSTPHTPIDNREACEKLNDLIQLDHDAIEAYEAAIERLDSAEYRARMQEFCDDHRRHTSELGAQVRLLGGTPKQKGDFMAMLTKGKVVIGNLAEDRGILMAMNANEKVTNETYEHVLEKLAGHADLEPLVRRNLEDERRHKAWIETALEAMGDSTHPGRHQGARGSQGLPPR